MELVKTSVLKFKPQSTTPNSKKVGTFRKTLLKQYVIIS